MHELSLAAEVMRIIEDAALRDGFRRVRTVRLEIGALSSVEPEAMSFCFDSVAMQSVAEGAKLEIVSTRGVAWCASCAETVAIGAVGEACPRCGGYRLQVTGGDQMRVKELEVE